MTADVVFLTVLLGVVAGALYWARLHLAPDEDDLVDAIEALLPGTQCAQCGHPGCRPYARAVAGGAPVDLCPPGGPDTQRALATLLGRASGAPLPAVRPMLARIDEQRCIGCYLCVEACPVDAIVGAPRFLHTVLNGRCTGCELCLAPCPVDCIELIARAPGGEPAAETGSITPGAPAADHCIRCNRCEPVCPEDLPVPHLWWVSQAGDLDRAAALGLDRCIECGLCNPPCPSHIDLVGTFTTARHALAARARNRAAADLARRHAADREQRLARQARSAADSRNRRLAALGRDDPP